jgi:malate permease and related proteins
LRLPMLPALGAALLAKWYIGHEDGGPLPKILSDTTRYLANGLVPIALVTLGAQLAKSPRWPRWKPVTLVSVIRLGVSGVLMWGLLYLAGLIWTSGGPLAGIDPKFIILTATTPTAVNTLLLTLELGGDADLAADCVFWTTILSIVSMAAWLVVLGIG